MKTLILTLVLLLSPCAWGQMTILEKPIGVWIDDGAYMWERFTVQGDEIWIEVSFQKSRPRNIPLPKLSALVQLERAEENLIAARILSLWGEYEKDCWADSTHQRLHDAPEGEWCIVDWECLIGSHWSMVWTHRTPDLLGFMAHLKRRGK